MLSVYNLLFLFIYKKSDQSLSSSTSKQKMNAPMSSKKMLLNKKRRKNKTKKNIKKLFDSLRNQSNSSSFTSIDISANDTVIPLDTTDNKSAVLSILTPSKYEISTQSNPNKRKRNSDSLIVINDDDLVINNELCQLVTPHKRSRINCSTPLAKKDSKTLQDLIINNFPSTKIVEQKLTEDIINLTREINKDSYLTIDLTTESDKTKQNTVIDLDNTADSQDCTVVSVNASNTTLSMSGDSDVTVLRNSKPQEKNSRHMKKFTNGIANLNASEKGKLLEFITQKIFSGCKVPSNITSSLANIQEPISRATETVEDTYIKEVILGQTQSRNSIGSNIYRPERDRNRTGLRMIVIDGSNVALEHSKGRVFSVKGLKICIDYFLKRGHVVKAFVPRFRCKFNKSTEPRLLDQLERQGLVVYTPSREVQGRTITPYDDRYIVQCAAEFDGIIVSGDNYRDLLQENPRWRFVIEKRLLQFTWVNDMIMFPRDPLGRYGPSLEQFLRHSPENVPSSSTENKSSFIFGTNFGQQIQ